MYNIYFYVNSINNIMLCVSEGKISTGSWLKRKNE
jgi:hypothetical protein